VDSAVKQTEKLKLDGRNLKALQTKLIAAKSPQLQGESLYTYWAGKWTPEGAGWKSKEQTSRSRAISSPGVLSHYRTYCI
jgi:hypothetical protein